ncbi:MAG: hypothetical protein KDE56_33935, partial [Anaerolineales bacterium]|nr:hypothetical protein [Anaerolineales bacterium]
VIGLLASHQPQQQTDKQNLSFQRITSSLSIEVRRQSAAKLLSLTHFGGWGEKRPLALIANSAKRKKTGRRFT